MAEPFAFHKPKPRVAVVGGMMAYFETIMPAGFRQERLEHARAAAGKLLADFDVTEIGLWADSDDTADIRNRLMAANPDVVVFVPTMATPPHDLANIFAECGVPVVIACAHELTEITSAYDMAELCRHSCNVGATMMGAMLRRLPKPVTPILVSGFLDDGSFFERLNGAVQAGGLVQKLRSLRIGRLGEPQTGYAHVGLSAEEASASGATLVDIPFDVWQERNSAVSEKQIEEFCSSGINRFLPKGTAYEVTANFRAAARMALALDAVADEFDLDCGSLACRGSFGVGLEVPSIGCLATSLMTTTYRPFSATGDLVTAIAMLIGKTLGGATLYCELDAIDRARDSFLVANTGEGDFGYVPDGGKTVICDAGAHSGRDVPGLVIEHELEPGPATMIGVTLDHTASRRLSLIALEGETEDPAHTGLKVTNGWFQTKVRPAVTAFERWANASATHHGALSKGHLTEQLSWIAGQTGLNLTSIPEPYEANK